MRSQLYNIKLRKLLSLDQDRFEYYNNVLKYVNGKADIDALENLPFGDIIKLKKYIQLETYEGIAKCFEVVHGINKKDLFKLSVLEFYSRFNWIKENLKKLIDREHANLKADADEKLKLAGLDRLNIFGELNTLIAIAEKYGKTPQEVEGWQYSLVFSLMLHSKISGDIYKRYTELLNPKK